MSPEEEEDRKTPEQLIFEAAVFRGGIPTPEDEPEDPDSLVPVRKPPRLPLRSSAVALPEPEEE